MKITFLVGNGFDLSSGINTSYNGFYEWYIAQPSKSKAIERFKAEIDNYMKTSEPEERKKSCWADFEVALGDYTKAFTKETVNEYLEVYEDAHEGLADYLEYIMDSINTDDIDSVTIQQLSKGLSHFYNELTPVEVDQFNSIFNANRSKNRQTQFVSFNYTDALDAIISKISKNPLSIWQYGDARLSSVVSPNVIHIHGSTGISPILGVYDKTQIANKDLLDVPEIEQILIKEQSIKVIGERWYSEATKTIRESDIICIWGLSLGKTDAHWWKIIINWLSSNAAHQLVIFWHQIPAPSKRSILQLLQTKRKVIEQFLSYSELNTDKNKGLEQQIHVIINTEKVLKLSFQKKSELHNNDNDG